MIGRRVGLTCEIQSREFTFDHDSSVCKQQLQSVGKTDLAVRGWGIQPIRGQRLEHGACFQDNKIRPPE